MWGRKQKLVQSVEDPKVRHHGGYPEVKNPEISQFILNTIVPIVGTSPYPLSELQLMVSAVCWLRPRKIIEWGTYIGTSARIFSETITYYNVPATVYSIDLPSDVSHIEHPGKECGRMVRAMSNVHLIQGDGVTEATKILGESKGYQALVFLDGDHAYSSVKRELQILGKRYPLLSILLHDTFDQVKASGYNTGPHQAIREYLSSHPSKYSTFETCLGLPGMTLLLPKK